MVTLKLTLNLSLLYDYQLENCSIFGKYFKTPSLNTAHTLCLFSYSISRYNVFESFTMVLCILKQNTFLKNDTAYNSVGHRL